MMGKLERFGEDVGLRKREKGLLGGLVMQDKSPALLRSVINHLQRFSVLCFCPVQRLNVSQLLSSVSFFSSSGSLKTLEGDFPRGIPQE